MNVLRVAVLAGLWLLSMPVYAERPAVKYRCILADWGESGPPAAVLNMLQKYPGLCLTAAWPATAQPPAAVTALVASGKLVPGMTIPDEPLLPLVYATADSSGTVLFSRPDDVRNILARSIELYRGCFTGNDAGWYARAGLFSTALVPELMRFGISWVVLPAAAGSGGCLVDGLLVLTPAQEAFASPEECWQWLAGTEDRFRVLRFDQTNPLTAEMVAYVGEQVQLTNGAVKFITPKQCRQMAQFLGPAVPAALCDQGPWTRRPAVWQKLMVARQAMDAYQNSGVARLQTLDLLREELYGLYAAALLARLQAAADQDGDGRFMTGLHTLYRVMNKPVPPEIGDVLDTAPAAAPAGDQPVALNTATVTVTTETLHIALTPEPDALLAVREFSVLVTSSVVQYTVNIGTAVLTQPFWIDIYMDLNNQRGAGLARLLPGAQAFMRDTDAWELALRIDRYQASFYRAGRLEPVLVRTFRIGKRYVIDIPRDLVRGNPLCWGYQVVVVNRSDIAVPVIADVLAADTASRERLLQQTPVQLPAFRAARSIKTP